MFVESERIMGRRKSDDPSRYWHERSESLENMDHLIPNLENLSLLQKNSKLNICLPSQKIQNQCKRNISRRLSLKSQCKFDFQKCPTSETATQGKLDDWTISTVPNTWVTFYDPTENKKSLLRHSQSMDSKDASLAFHRDQLQKSQSRASTEENIYIDKINNDQEILDDFSKLAIARHSSQVVRSEKYTIDKSIENKFEPDLIWIEERQWLKENPDPEPQISLKNNKGLSSDYLPV